eukprot:TRINITY_DN418_c0_g1_i2.p2 TRINITY_DN418_c0_g1~~TRINITY_DN418_c0_g1_i2.p2  ORF type:complete len:259 (-),score=55.62 TRINITY_DN418_c0_g1_i2:294-1070(-)
MVLILCMGDSNIPHRASDLPPKFKELLKPGKIHQVLCPGNLCSREFYDYLRTVCSSIEWARGDFDEDVTLPDQIVKKIEGLSVGICHGHQVIPWGDKEALGILIRQMGVDVLVTGYTHQHAIYKYENTLVVNPGSATGSFSLLNKNSIPSFILMDLRKTSITAYVYQLVDGNLKVEKIEHTISSDGKLELVQEKPVEVVKEEKAPKKPVEVVKEEKAPEKPASIVKEEKAPEKPESEAAKTEQQTNGTEASVEFATED